MNFLLRFSLIVITFFPFSHSLAQNLVRNGSFEDIDTHCPAGISQIAHARHWFSPNANTPDVFCACANRKYFFAGVPANFAGFQQPRTGTCYAGIICYYGPSEYLEFVSAKLSEPLQKEKKYCVSFHYSLANYSEFTVSSLGVCFTKRPPRISGDKPGNVLITAPASNDSSRWNRFEYIYTATGKEKYLTIGAFGAPHAPHQPQRLSKKLQNLKMRPLKAAYYYIDDVCVTEIQDSCRCFPDPANVKPLVEEVVTEAADTLINQIVVLQNVNFETAKAELLPSAYAELDKLAAMLNDNVGLRIDLSGHTDNVGKEEDNLKLSEARAFAVAEYLRLKGVERSRITYKGYGSAQPIADNGIEEGRRLNRRVQFFFYY